MRDFVRRLVTVIACAAVLVPAPAGMAQVDGAAPAAPVIAAPPTAPAPPAARPGVRHARGPLAPAAVLPAPVSAVPVSPQRLGARLAPGMPIPPAELEAFVDGTVRQAMADNHIAGATISVVQNGQVVMSRGYGYASLTPLRPVNPNTTLFRIGSISKTFTWIEVLRQVEAGQMRLDMPINRYLPMALQVRDQGFDQPIRVRDLMNHTPGFEDRTLGQLFERDASRVRPLNVYLRQERPRRVREPMTLPSYSNYGAALAGAAVAEVSGQSYENLVERTIILPLGMTHTTFREARPVRAGLPAPMPAPLAADISQPFHWTGTGFQERPYEFIGQVAPAGAASSTASDMARYMMMILAGGTLDGATIYGPRTAQALSTPLPPPSRYVTAFNHGFFRYDLPGQFPGVGHAGGTLSFASQMTLVPELQLGVFISTNTDTGSPLAGGLPSAIVEHFYGTPAAPLPGDPALREAAGAYEGDYLTTRRAYSGLEGFVFRLIGSTHITVTRDGALLTASTLGGAGRWTPDGPLSQGVFRSASEAGALTMEMQNGRAVRAYPPGGIMALERVGFWRQTGVLTNLAILVLIASLATLAGVLLRNRRDQRETTSQSRASLMQTTEAVLWILAVTCFALWGMGAGDLASVVYNWPGLLLMMASATALVASLLSVASLPLLAVIWRGGRRVESWTGGRKLRFTVTTVLFFAFAMVLFQWGALEPWSG